MASGTVKWFNDAKGFGFIEPAGGGADVFAHFSAIQMDGYRTIKQGSPVEFDLIEGPKGLLATNIRAVGVAADARAQQGDERTPRVRAPQFHANQIQNRNNTGASHSNVLQDSQQTK
jgi:cold shock protein